jgi:hypothetical protein
VTHTKEKKKILHYPIQYSIILFYGSWHNNSLTTKLEKKTQDNSGDHFLFGSVFIKKKAIKPNFLLKKTETGSNRPVSVRFSFLGQKPVQTGLARFFPVWIRFGFFGFRLIKPDRTGRFF